jgi:hypothetical protein
MSKPSSPKSPKDAKPGGEKKALDLGELMQRLDEAVAKTIEDYSELFVTKYVKIIQPKNIEIENGSNTEKSGMHCTFNPKTGIQLNNHSHGVARPFQHHGCIIAAG